MATNKELGREIETLRRQIYSLQQHRLLTDNLDSRQIGALLNRYVSALSHLTTEMQAVTARAPYGEGGRGRGETPTPSPVPSWADALMKKHIRFLEQRIDELEGWLDKPYPPRKHRRKNSSQRCSSCGGGLMKGAKFCSRCGAETVADI